MGKDLVKPSGTWTGQHHPGQVLAHELSERGLDKRGLLKRFCQEIGWSQTYLSDLTSCRRSMTPQRALDLERQLDISALWWLTQQAKYDLYKLRHES